jgi:aminoglycoside phosphotransferase (APT) family kinase protein
MLAGERDLQATRERLAQWLEAKQPEARGLRISELRKPSAGLSNETFLFEASWRDGAGERREQMVARLQPTEFQVFPEYDLSMQYRILERLQGTDVPVPRVRWFEEDTSVLGSSFYVMDRVEGEIPSEVPPYHCFGLCYDATPQRRARIWWGGIEALARIHRLDWRRLDLAFLGVPGGGVDPLDRQLTYYQRYLEWACGDDEQPILRAASRWLQENHFAPTRVALCWGDSRLPNMMFRDDRVVAVLDWEMAHLGDPEADLAWWLFLDWTSCDGYGFPRLEGFPSKEETIARYEELTGAKVEHAFYYEVWAAFRFGVIMARVATRLKQLGLPVPNPSFESNNVCTHALARLLELPPPGEPIAAPPRDAEELVRVQFHLTGPGGGDWYLEQRGGRSTRHEGIAEGAVTVLTASAADWHAVQSGEIGRTEAFFSGRLKIDGDVSLLLQLEDAISKLGRG